MGPPFPNTLVIHVSHYLLFFLPLVLRFIIGASTWPPPPYTPRFPRCILSSDFEHLSVYPCTSAYLLTCLISGDSHVLFQAVIPSIPVTLYLCKQCRSRLVLEKAQGMTPVVIYLFILLFT